MIDSATEQRLADGRARLRQDKRVPLLIRDDGMLYPNTVLVARKSNFRPYHGDPKATLADRLRYLQGLGAKRAVVYSPEPDEPFDIGQADADALVQFAMEQYGSVLDPSKPLKVLREQVFRLSQLPELQSGSAIGALPDGDDKGGINEAPQLAEQQAQPLPEPMSDAPRPRAKPGPKPKGLGLSAGA